ncbi:superoxide dismutase [Candidatus Mycoplasma haematohominis]|uniref:Superoxide dismutase n=1 Tax=Candidatus Mycoplasma haematohominis TaxID=1494318 RepID=A0A478FPE9_9MOLU|nr:superoxide dismutase [Candidatus Mycoplasma haemohominis]GCE63231.1 superoxide dismutase [Mn] 2 [Candidatus Mycoplasma haemohominis]
MFSPKPLKFSFSDYSPAISEEIMTLHYKQHYFGYINNLNTAISKYPDFFKFEVSQILERIKEIPEDIQAIVRNNGGGVVNHEILWDILDKKETQIHDGVFKEDVSKAFGGWDKFIEQFMAAGGKLFGSGWVWLVFEKGTKNLKIMSTSNQDSPYMDGHYPIFGIDVWEHAYYLQYKNMKVNYLKEIWKIVDWKEVEKRYLSRKN